MVGIGCGAASGEPEHDHESRYGDDGRHPGPFRPPGDGKGGAHHEETAEDEREPEVASGTQPLAGRGFGGRQRRVVAEEHTTGKSHHPTERERNRSELGLGHQRVRVCRRRDLLILRGGHFASHTWRGGDDPDLTGQADVIVGLEHEFLPFGPDGEPIVKRLDAYVTNLPVPDQLIPVKEADPNSVGEHLHLDTGSGLTPHAHDAPSLNRQFLPPLAKVGDQ